MLLVVAYSSAVCVLYSHRKLDDPILFPSARLRNRRQKQQKQQQQQPPGAVSAGSTPQNPMVNPSEFRGMSWVNPLKWQFWGLGLPETTWPEEPQFLSVFGTELSIVAGQLNLNSPVLVAGDPSPATPHLHGKRGAMRSTRPVRFDLFWWIHFKRNIEGIGHDWTGFISYYSYYFLWSFPTLEDVLPGTTRPQRLQRPKQRCQTGAMTPAMGDWLNHQPASHVEPPVLLVPSYHDTTGQISFSLVYPSSFGLNLAFCW